MYEITIKGNTPAELFANLSQMAAANANTAPAPTAPIAPPPVAAPAAAAAVPSVAPVPVAPPCARCSSRTRCDRTCGSSRRRAYRRTDLHA